LGAYLVDGQIRQDSNNQAFERWAGWVLCRFAQSILACVNDFLLPVRLEAIKLLLSLILLLLIFTDDFGFLSFLRATITGALDLVTK
jgi:hypothetical protein